MSIDVVIASTESPANSPAFTPSAGRKCAASSVTTDATAIFVASSVPDLRSTMPVARKSIVAPMQKNHTARIGTVPAIRPLVNEPKYLPAAGANRCDAILRAGFDQLCEGVCQPSPRLFCNDTKSFSNSACPATTFCCAENSVRCVSSRSMRLDAPAR